MAGDERWYFTKEEINNSPSRKCGVDAEKELSYRQQGAKLIQDMGQRLQVTQLVINTAIVYMHRFYMFHPFTRFHRNSIAPAALFLAAKVEEQPRKLEHVIKVAHYILCHHDHTNLDTQSETYMEKAQELVMNENILLQTLGFDVAIDHPHTYVVKCFQMVRTPTELAQTSYFMATNSLHMTTMCLQYKPAVVACVCIYIVCKWSNYEIQRFTEGKDWFCHVDPTVTLEMLEMLTSEFLAVLDKYPNRLKKLMNSGPHGGPSSNSFGDERSRHGSSLTMSMRPQSLGGTGSSMRSHDLVKSGSVKALSQPSATSKTVLSHKEYSEKKEKERREREKERERVEHREKHTLHPPLTSTSSSSSSHHIPSSNTVSTHPPHISHSRSQPTEASVRKSHLDNNRQPVIHGSSNRGTIPAPAFKESNLKREVLSNRSDERLDKQERTSDNNVDSAKFVNEKLKSSGDHRHSHSGDWNQSRHLDYVKDRKVDLKTEIKTDIKPGLKDSRPVEGRDHKIESSTKVFENKNIPKNEPLVKVKSEKVESKDEFKVQGIDEIKSNNSFIFNNNDFSLRDFLNPSELPPEDIFDTEVDSKPNLIDAEFLPTETTHHKLKSPPKPYSLAQSLVVPTVSSSGSSKGNNSSNSKQTLDTLRANVEAKVSKHSSVTAAATNVYMHGNHTSDKNLGNGLHSAPNLMPSGPQTLQNPSSRRKEKGRSPHSLASHTPATKVKHQNSSSEPVSLPTPAKIEDHKQVSAKDSATTHNQVLPKDSQPGVPQRAGSAAPAISSLPTTSEKTGTLIQNQQSSFVPIKTSSLPEPPKIDTSINVRLSRPENCDVNPVSSAAAAAAAPAAAPAAAAPAAAAAAPPPPIAANASSTVITSPVKKHKYDHGRHKHKEKKKHKHKEKDKHKEKESKDHKEHKKLRKHKKHKEKERERDEKKEKEKEREKQQPAKEDGVSRPLKITILRRNKGVYTPDVGSTTVGRTPTVTPVAEKDTPSSSNLDTPGRIKLTIPKSRLQVNAAPGSQGSPPRGIPPKELATPKVKLKIQKDHLKSEKGEKESRKRDRDRSPADNVHPSKISRSSSSYNAPQVGKNPLLPHTPLTKKSFQGKPVKQTAFSHVSQLPPQPHIQPILNPHPPLYPQNPQNHSYPIDQFGMPMSMNYSTYPPYGGMSIPNMPDPSFTQGGIAPNQYYAPFYPQYSLPMPNINIPPPPAYQTSHFNIPPPGYTPQPPQPYIPPQSQSSENPPLPAGPPPKKPPTPPLE